MKTKTITRNIKSNKKNAFLNVLNILSGMKIFKMKF